MGNNNHEINELVDLLWSEIEGDGSCDALDIAISLNDPRMRDAVAADLLHEIEWER